MYAGACANSRLAAVDEHDWLVTSIGMAQTGEVRSEVSVAMVANQPRKGRNGRGGQCVSGLSVTCGHVQSSACDHVNRLGWCCRGEEAVGVSFAELCVGVLSFDGDGPGSSPQLCVRGSARPCRPSSLNTANPTLKGLAPKVPTFGTSGFAVTLLRLAIRSPLHQRRVLARYRCSEALGRHTRRQTMLTSSDAALAKSFAAAR